MRDPSLMHNFIKVYELYTYSQHHRGVVLNSFEVVKIWSVLLGYHAEESVDVAVTELNGRHFSFNDHCSVEQDFWKQMFLFIILWGTPSKRLYFIDRV